ncbi:uncharacterized protein STEHIDRAFT_156287 [Stereum hirsutum FP-91666 SS1]|uniref:uncharacterized protein n=1 Tax=Stereum hirsutum (strain FP-91666) TaxID=721885 RepID=UPI000440D02B|nr:uncharacterized protein STEHIDRAFT_156287 [Stereum hirsutum FP-91666 SS1]EIM87306.1 hypothetical protein STEHIDRAFT_156287 [Stereum hirsutum FP-91666 SS1]
MNTPTLPVDVLDRMTKALVALDARLSGLTSAVDSMRDSFDDMKQEMRSYLAGPSGWPAVERPSQSTTTHRSRSEDEPPQRLASVYATLQHDLVPPDPMYTPQWSGVIIHPDGFDLSPLKDPESLIGHLDLCLVEFDQDGAVTKQSLADLIGSAGATCFTNAYDRDSRIDDWYYAFYADMSDTTSPPNPIADIVKPASDPPIRGRVLVVLNGPEDGTWELTQRISEVVLGRTLWWYRMSGNTVWDVFGERELRRYVRTMTFAIACSSEESPLAWRTSTTVFRRVHIPKDASDQYDALSSHRSYVPIYKTELLHWLRVISASCNTREILNYPFNVVYGYSLNLPSPRRVEIRVQGVLELGAMATKVRVSRTTSLGSDLVRWMQLGYGRPKYRERFEAQIKALRRIADTCKVQIGLSPSTLPLPRSLYLRRREDTPVRLEVPDLEIFDLNEDTGVLENIEGHHLNVGDLLDVNVHVEPTSSKSS